jgi:integrase
MRGTNKLTSLKVARLNKPGRYGDGGGLWLQVSKWGTKSWLLRYTRNGRARQMGLGSVDTFSLKEARERARIQRQLLADGIDPLVARGKAKDAERIEMARSITFEDAAERYISAHKAGWKNGKHADQWASTLATYAYPIFGGLPVGAIDTGHILKVLEPIWTRKTETASRVRGRIEAILDWATARGYRTGENCARWKGHLAKLLPAKTKVAKVHHQPAMPYSEIPNFMVELRKRDGISARALEFCILTAARTGEVIGARWEEIDSEARLWIVPSSRTKSAREHRVPLSDRAIQVLRSIPREHDNPYVFPGVREGEPLSNMSMLELLKGMNSYGYTVHGFRATFKTWTSEQTAYPNEVSEAALGHANGDKVEAAYKRTTMLEKRRRLMEAWASFCTRPANRGEIVSIGRRKS